ncbi:endonuclease/exonuclease/phosphatase family protein [Nonomuraea sp. NPDC059194]|uniref:endonuclease/exonuclease/phosphatase family protein n=1 Tax=Nonomuraea sp. NPDC059194 TaxID=3346764 RepID=UPI003696FB2C
MLLLALGLALLCEVLRVFLPSLITLFGRAGETPAELMGLYAAAWFVLPCLAPLLRPRWSLLGGATVLVVARLGLQAFDGGMPQLALASAGVSAGLFFLYGCARTLPRAAVPTGIAGGLAFAVTIHLLLDGVDLVWRDGPLPWLAVLTLCAAFLALLRLAPPPSEDLAPGNAWFLLGPSLLLVGMSAGLSTAAWHDRPLWLAAFALGLALMVWPPAFPWSTFVYAALLCAGTAVMLATGHGALVPVGVGGLLAAAGRPGPSARRPGAGLLGGGLVFLAGVFGYYAAYDMDLGFPNTVVVVAVALAAAAAAGTGAAATAPTAFSWRPLVAAVVIAGLGLASWWRAVPAVQEKRGDTFTLVAYNIRMGFGLDGRLSLDEIARWAAGERPDVVLLSEVDRGWLLNGGHDDLDRIARGLGMRAYFAPAADPVWGDALLTNLPVRQLASHPLGRHGYPTLAQAQAAVIEVGGREVGIVNTHLQSPPGQAPEVAALVHNLASGMSAAEAGGRPTGPMSAGGDAAAGARRPVVLAGDLNTRPGDPEMRVLESAGLSDPLTALGDPATSPADAPVERIDHVLLTDGLAAESAEVPRLPYSDHLPVKVTMRITSVDQEG